MKISPNIDGDERDRVFSVAVGIVGLRGTLITRTRPCVVARIPFNTLFNLGHVRLGLDMFFFLRCYPRKYATFKTYHPLNTQVFQKL